MNLPNLWKDFSKIFPYGDTTLLEGEYQALVEKTLNTISDEEERSLFIDLLDTQWVVFAEQQHLLAELHDKSGVVFYHDAPLAIARIQLNDNIRRANGLKKRNVRRLVFEVLNDKTILDALELCNLRGKSNGTG